MNILNNGRFGMVAGLSGTMKMAIRKSIVSFDEWTIIRNERILNRILRKIVNNSVIRLIPMEMSRKN